MIAKPIELAGSRILNTSFARHSENANATAWHCSQFCPRHYPRSLASDAGKLHTALLHHHHFARVLPALQRSVEALSPVNEEGSRQMRSARYSTGIFERAAPFSLRLRLTRAIDGGLLRRYATALHIRGSVNERSRDRRRTAARLACIWRTATSDVRERLSE